MKHYLNGMLMCAVVLCLMVMTVVVAEEEEQQHYFRDGFEYVLDKPRYSETTEARVVAYHGKFLPRKLPAVLDGYPAMIPYSYKNPCFQHLIKFNDLYAYGAVSETEAYIVGYIGHTQVARIPDEIDGLWITGIGDAAFAPGGYIGPPFADVVIVPGSVKYIGNGAFSCTDIGYILLEEGVEEIDDVAFFGHNQQNFILPSTVTKLGVNPFVKYVEGSVNAYLFPTVYDNEVFKVSSLDCGRMLYNVQDMRIITYSQDINSPYHEIEIPDGIMIIGEQAFALANGLEKVTLPATVLSIEEGAFWLCSTLKELKLSDGLTSIGDYAFQATDIYSLYIPSSVTSIGKNILNNFTGRSWAPDEVATIICDPGSTAEAYALANGYPVEYR